MTRLRTEPRSPGPLANTLLIRLVVYIYYIIFILYISYRYIYYIILYHIIYKRIVYRQYLNKSEFICLYSVKWFLELLFNIYIAQFTGVVEYTDCFSAEE